MKVISSRRYFLRNEEAVSEEFTVLPALSVVIIGFALFAVLLAQTYIAYTNHINQLYRYQTADRILQKIINPDCFFIRSPGIVDLHLLQNNTEMLQGYFHRYPSLEALCRVQIHWGNHTWFYPEISSSASLDYVAISKVVGVYCNEAQTLPGIITVSFER
jgi:hypothetical protein